MQTLLSIEFDFQDEKQIQNIEYELSKLGPLNCALDQFVNFTSKNQQPIVKPASGRVPKDIRALYRMRTPMEDICPHFFTNDAHIEQVWTHPLRYIKVLQRYGWTIAPDLSLYINMVRNQKHWNAFRNKFLSAVWQRFGIDVIPAPSWGDMADIEFYLEGWPKQSLIALNSTGIGNNLRGQKQFMDGYEAVLDILQPTHILRYGTAFEGERVDISTYYTNDNRKEANYGR